MASLTFTGERIVPGQVDLNLFRDHEARYNFARRFVKGKVVLDVACGTGIGTQHLLDAGAQSCLGVDISLETIGYARSEYGNCRFECGDAANLALPGESVDVLVSFETLEHLPDQIQFLHECYRLLMPGGTFICSTPNRAAFRWVEPNPFHIREFYPEEYIRLIASMFSEVKAYSQNELNYPAYVVRRVLSDALQRVNLRNVVNRMRGKKPSPLTDAARFDAAREPDIKPYMRGTIRQPLYVLTVGRKRG